MACYANLALFTLSYSAANNNFSSISLSSPKQTHSCHFYLEFYSYEQDITGRIAQEREYTRLIDTANAPIFGVNTDW